MTLIHLTNLALADTDSLNDDDIIACRLTENNRIGRTACDATYKGVTTCKRTICGV